MPIVLADVYYRDVESQYLYSRDTEGTSTLISTKSTESRMLGLAVDQNKIFWSTGTGIYQANVDDGSEKELIVLGIVRVLLKGKFFQDSAVKLKGIPCTLLESKELDEVECITANVANIDPSDVSISTTEGTTKGITTQFDEMFASGYTFPLVKSISITNEAFEPHAIVIADSTWLYWSDTKSFKIYRSHLDGSSVQSIVEDVGLVFGIDHLNDKLFYTSETHHSLFSVPGDGSGAPQILRTGLESPRGVCIDSSETFAFVADKMASIEQISLTDSESSRWLLLSTMSRLDGLAIDDADEYIYWTESNTNVVARASIKHWRRQIIVGNSPDRILRWPRSVAVKNNKLYVTEYAGRILTGLVEGETGVQDLMIESMSDSMERLDHSVRVCSAAGSLQSAFIAID